MTTDLFGTGIARPVRPDETGGLRTSTGEARVWESIEAIWSTPKGTRPMDPEYGIETGVYDPIQNAEAFAWELASAVSRSDPRVDSIQLDILAIEGDGLVRLRATAVLVGSHVETSRILGVYALT